MLKGKFEVCYDLAMDDFDLDSTDEQTEEIASSSDAVFTCPKDGKIPQDEVVFLCNNCSRDQVIYKNGIYICPSCLKPGENFECMRCGSKEVKMKIKD